MPRLGFILAIFERTVSPKKRKKKKNKNKKRKYKKKKGKKKFKNTQDGFKTRPTPISRVRDLLT